MILIAPSIEYDEQIQAYRREFLEYGGSMDGCGSLRRFDRTQDWLDQVEALKRAETTPPELVPMTQYHEGIILGYSAGAVIQLRDYHLSPDKDYPEFAYYSGFPFIDDFYLEVHYEGTPEQNASIKRVLSEKQKPVFATYYMHGAIIVDNGRTNLIGSVSKFDCPKIGK